MGERILIIDDTPVNLKLTRILLVHEGYEVRTAPDAEQALSMLENYHPDLMLVDIQLPGMDGLEFARRVKGNPRTSDIVVVALTAFAMRGDEQKAFQAGCDGYITKPIDTRTLSGRLREILNTHQRPGPPGAEISKPGAPQPEPFSFAGPEVDGLRDRFVAEGLTKTRLLLDAMDAQFDTAGARKVMHQWVGAASLLGYPAISRMSREIEQLLDERPLDNAQLRELLIELIFAFSDSEDRIFPVPETIARTLTGKQCALIGFADREGRRVGTALGRAQAAPAFFAASEPPDCGGIARSDVLLVHVRAETMMTSWLSPEGLLPEKPLVLVGAREDLLALDASVQNRASELLMEAWPSEEAVLRVSMALSRAPAVGPTGDPDVRQTGRPQVMVADSHAETVARLRELLVTDGMEWNAAEDDRSALEKLRTAVVDAAVLAMNSPGLNGLELLGAIRARHRSTPVVLISARREEAELVRGLAMGADDFVLYPFSRMELVVRLKRLLTRRAAAAKL